MRKRLLQQPPDTPNHHERQANPLRHHAQMRKCRVRRSGLAPPTPTSCRAPPAPAPPRRRPRGPRPTAKRGRRHPRVPLPRRPPGGPRAPARSCSRPEINICADLPKFGRSLANLAEVHRSCPQVGRLRAKLAPSPANAPRSLEPNSAETRSNYGRVRPAFGRFW